MPQTPLEIWWTWEFLLRTIQCVCKWASVCVHVCVCFRVHACVCAWARVCIRVHACVCACECACVHVCVCIWVHVCVWAHACICVRAHTCMCTALGIMLQETSPLFLEAGSRTGTWGWPIWLGYLTNACELQSLAFPALVLQAYVTMPNFLHGFWGLNFIILSSDKIPRHQHCMLISTKLYVCGHNGNQLHWNGAIKKLKTKFW